MKRDLPHHYAYDDIMAAADDLGDRYQRAVIVLAEGDTVESALSHKYDFAGPGTVEYLMHPSGWTIRPSKTVTKLYR